MKFKELLRKILPHQLFWTLRKTYYSILPSKRKEIYRLPYRFKGGNENPELKFYIFRASIMGHGIFAFYREMISNISWALAKGYTPVIDYEWDCNFVGKKMDIDNVWEHCFEQPATYSLKEIVRSKCVTVGRISELNEDILPLARVVTEDLDKYYEDYIQISKKYLRIKPERKNQFNETFKNIFPKDKKIVGICLRDGFTAEREAGNDYMLYHPKEPCVNDVIKKTRELVEEWGCDYVYLTAQFQDTVNLFYKEFGEKLLTTDRERYDKAEFTEYVKEFELLKDKVSLDDYCKIAKNSRFNCADNDGLAEYIQEIYGLSQCDYFIGTKNGGTIISLIWSELKYKDLFIFEDINHSKLY